MESDYLIRLVHSVHARIFSPLRILGRYKFEHQARAFRSRHLKLGSTESGHVECASNQFNLKIRSSKAVIKSKKP